MNPASERSAPRRSIELVAACADRVGLHGLALAVTVSIPGRGMVRKTFLHDETAKGLARAWGEAGRWIRGRCQ